MSFNAFPELTDDQLAMLEGEASEDEMEVELDEGVETEDGGMEFDIVDPESQAAVDEVLIDQDHYTNLAEFLPDDVLGSIGADLIDKVKADDQSREEWRMIIADGMDLLGLKIEDLTEPFEGSCSAVHPVLIESITKFQSKSSVELFPSRGPVKTQILGRETEERREQGRRVKEFMNFQLQHQMTEYGPETDRMLFGLAYMGSAFKKCYYDRILERPVSIYISPQDFIVPYHTTDLDTAERYTHVINMSGNEILENQLVGNFRENLSYPPVPANDDDRDEITDAVDEIEGRSWEPQVDEIYKLYEVHADYKIEGVEDDDPRALPYVFTVDSQTGVVLSIRRNWREQDTVKKQKRLYFTHYEFVPGFGFYAYGYLHLIGGLARSATTSLRQLIDAGMFANLPAGFKAHGLRVMGDNSPIMPGEWRDVNVPAMDLKSALQPLPYKEPSQTLFNLMVFVVGAAEKFADETQALVGENSATYGPVGTIMALLETGGKLQNAIQKRLHRAQGREFKTLAELNFEWLPETYPYETAQQDQEVLRMDFDGRIDVIPVSDPNMPTNVHRMARANAIFAIAAQAPQEHNMRNVLYNLYDTMDIEDPNAFLKPLPQQAVPLDPVTENVNMMNGMPAKAGEHQNHPAHMRAHAAFMNLPAAKTNPVTQSAIMAHIIEHFTMDYRLRIQRLMGVPLPESGKPMPPELENQVAEAAAVASEEMMNDEMLKQVMSDPQLMVAMKGLQLEHEGNIMDYKIDLQKLGLEKREQDLDHEDRERDRQKDVAVAQIRAESKHTQKVKVKDKRD